MTSYRQIEANRRNALKSTGPKTEAGKQASRCNAVRHGLTAETVLSAFEDAEDYKAFEAAITADYDAQSAVERELVVEIARCFLRLANLPNFALDRLSRYEATLWRQASRILHALEILDRRKPQERTRRVWPGSETYIDCE
jgi:hypothetical protein